MLVSSSSICTDKKYEDIFPSQYLLVQYLMETPEQYAKFVKN